MACKAGIMEDFSYTCAFFCKAYIYVYITYLYINI